MINTGTAQIFHARLKPDQITTDLYSAVSNKTWQQLYQCREENKLPLVRNIFRTVWLHFGKKIGKCRK